MKSFLRTSLSTYVLILGNIWFENQFLISIYFHVRNGILLSFLVCIGTYYVLFFICFFLTYVRTCFNLYVFYWFAYVLVRIMYYFAYVLLFYAVHYGTVATCNLFLLEVSTSNLTKIQHSLFEDLLR